MRKRCELCGARLRPEDTACRDCGAPRQGPPRPAPRDQGDDKAAASATISFTDIATPPSLGPEPSASTSSGEAEAVPGPAEVPGSTDADELDATGTKIADPTAATASAPTEAPLVAARPEPIPQESDDGLWDERPKSRGWLWLGAAVVVLGVGIAAFVAYPKPSHDDSPPLPTATTPDSTTPPPDLDPNPNPDADAAVGLPDAPSIPVRVSECAMLASVVGKWQFASEVTGARAVNKLGIRGYYNLEIAVDDCKGSATLTKTGFTGSQFGSRNVQHATADLHHIDGALSFGFGNRFVLRDESGKGGDQQFFFTTHEGKLVGVWRQRGREWGANRLLGILTGSRADPSIALKPTLADLPCPARCVIACDALSQADPAAAVGHATCTSACEAQPEQTAVCGTREAPTADLRLTLKGPEAELATLCPKRSCEVDPKVKRGRARHAAADKGPLYEGHFVRVGGSRRGGGEMRLALRVDAGWFLSGPVAPFTANGASDVSNARLVVTALGADAAPSQLVGHFTVKGTGAFVACRVESGAPVCIAVRELANIADVGVIAGGTVALRGETESSLRAW